MGDVNHTDASRQVSGGTETTYGTIASSLTGWLGLVQDFKGPVKKTIKKVDAMGLSRVANSVQAVAQDIQGSIERYPQNATLLRFLGSLGTAGSNPYTHTINPGVNPGSFSLSATSVDPANTTHATRNYLGCKLKSMQFGYAQRDMLKITDSWVAQDATSTSTKQSLTPATTAPYLTAVTALKVDTTEDANVYEANVTIDQGLSTDDHVFNTENIAEPGLGQYKITGTFSRNFLNSSIYAKILANTEADIDIVSTRGANDTFTLSLIDVKLNDHDLSSGLSGKSKETVSFEAESWQIVVVDSTSSYAF